MDGDNVIRYRQTPGSSISDNGFGFRFGLRLQGPPAHQAVLKGQQRKLYIAIDGQFFENAVAIAIHCFRGQGQAEQ